MKNLFLFVLVFVCITVNAQENEVVLKSTTGLTKFDGPVAIGCSLSNNFMLSVNGKIETKGISIQLGSANWPDYVFENTFKLKSIDELYEFITVNKHLPDFKSAEEIKKEGYEIDETVRLLVQKIEEQSLYIIELHERLKKLESEK